MRKWLKGLAAIALSSQFIVNVQASEFAGETVKIGLVSGPAEEVWAPVVEQAAADGITVEIVLFTDYVQPNIALAEGSLDLNAFQHIAFLDNWNEANDEDLAQIGYTFISPMGAYSDHIASLDELKEGDKVAIPNDPTNGGRALLALEIAGVLEVDDAAGALATPNDVTDNPLNLEFVELEAAQIPFALPDVAAAFINTNFATDAGLSLHDDSIFIDADYPDQLNEAYRNVIAARAEDAENPLYLQIVKYYQSEAVAQALYDTTNNGDKPAWENPPVIGEDGVDSEADEETSEEAAESETESE